MLRGNAGLSQPAASSSAPSRHPPLAFTPPSVPHAPQSRDRCMPPSERKPLASSKTKGVKPMPLPPAEPPAPRIAIGEVGKDPQNDLLRGLCERLSPAYATDVAGNIV